ncbi:hypothetical protein J4448_01740 [Candidatus Woesearchaeota archaeon]|nr:hypothetical protein [Candidatus Woesearchaeota archaeon]
MNNFAIDVKNDSTHNLGISIGFFAGFLLFASVFYFIMSFFNKLPSMIKYYHVFLFVVIVYLAGYIFSRTRK